MSNNDQGKASRDLKTGQWIRLLLSAKMVRLALLVTALGAALLAYGAMNRTTTGPGRTATGFTLQAPTGPGVTTTELMTHGAGMWMVQLGPCLLAGFVMGWGIRRVLPWTILLAAVAAISLCVMGGAGFFEVNYDQVHSSVDQGVDWAKSNAGSAKEWIMRTMPLTLVAVMGLFFGARR